MTVFGSLIFLFRFLPILLAVFFLAPPRYRDMVLLGGSIVFYASGEPVFIFFLFALIVFNYLIAHGITGHRGRLFAGVFVNVFILAGAKLLLLTGVGLPLPSGNSFFLTALPLGISFYIFKMISYLCDAYGGKFRSEPSFLQAALYFSLFFQAVQGPIMRYQDGFGSGKRKTPGLSDVERGLEYLVIGLGMKVLIADRLGILWNELLKIGYDSISTPLAWTGAFGYSLELFFDFWGYSVMASGIGVMFGFPFIVNFDGPYLAKGIGDFYRKWHMTLGSFFRDYVYIPLGGSRKGKLCTALNLMIVWALTGLWHGGTLNFLIWGLALGAMIVYEKLVIGKAMKKYAWIGHFHVLILIPVSWVIFAIPDLTELCTYLFRMFPLGGSMAGAEEGDALRFLGIYWPYFAAALLLCVPKVQKFLLPEAAEGGEYRGIEGGGAAGHTIAMGARLLLLFAIFWGSVYFISTTASNPFMYYSF